MTAPQKPDPMAALRAAFADAGQEIASAMAKAVDTMQAQTALRHLINGDENAAREALTKVSENNVVWAIGDAAHILTNLACDEFAKRVEDAQPTNPS